MAAHPPATIDPHAVEGAHDAADAAAHGGEHATGVFPPFDVSTFASQLVWFVITFGVLYIVLSRFVLPQIGGVLEARAGKIAEDLGLAAQKSADADEARTAMDRAIAKARADGRAMVDAARADMQAKLAAEQAQAETRLTQRIEAAEKRVGEARAKALAEVPGIADTLARDIAAKLVPANG